MGLLIFMQVILDLGFIATATWLLIDRSKSKTMEDPRLSRGLQLLSSKIAILQDLMDRSELMSRQLSQLIDGKQVDIQERLEEVEVYLHKIQKATERSQEVVDIFQDRVPHQEMIERQTSAKYLLAAKLANQGLSIEDIARQVDIPQGELDLIVKVNRDRLINPPDEPVRPSAITSVPAREQFYGQVPAHPPAPVKVAFPIQQPTATASQMATTPQMTPTSGAAPAASAPAAKKEIRPVIFKRISVLDDLG